GERQRNRAGGGVSVPVDVHDDFLVRDVELAGSVVDDADVRLVGDVDVDVLDRLSTLAENRLRRGHHHPGREPEHLASVHLDVLPGAVEGARPAAGEPEVPAPAAVRAELEAEEATLVDRLVQSRIDDSTSPPTTSARCASPAAIIPWACAIAYTKPVQPAARSYAAASGMPRRSASSAAVDGNAMSGVTVATTSRSIDAGSAPAISSARTQAGAERSDIASGPSASLRSRMPVRVTILSSDVSTIFERSSFVTTRSGTLHPRPVIEIGRPFVRPIIR